MGLGKIKPILRYKETVSQKGLYSLFSLYESIYSFGVFSRLAQEFLISLKIVLQRIDFYPLA